MPLDGGKINSIIFHSRMIAMKQDGKCGEQKKNHQALAVVFQFRNPLRWRIKLLVSLQRLDFRCARAASVVGSIPWLQSPAFCAEDAKIRHSHSLQRKF